MQVEVDIFSGSPNPHWNIGHEEAEEFLRFFQALQESRSEAAIHNGLGYNGLIVTELDNYIDNYRQVSVAKGWVVARRDHQSRQFVDQGRKLEQWLLRTGEGHIDHELYRLIHAAAQFKLDLNSGNDHLMASDNNSFQGLQTKAIHAGEKPDTTTRASSPSIVMSSSFVTDADTPFSAENLQDQNTFFYTREGNPTVQQLEQKLAALENTEACVAFSSGMAAISALMFHMLKPGDHLVMSDVAYVGAAELMKEFIPSLGIHVTRVNTTDLEAVQAAILPQTKLVHIETPCNPIVRLSDIQAIAEIAHAAGAKLSVDSTFATPVATRPIQLGADFVIHSLSKYLCGHGDAIGGAVLGTRDEMAAIRHLLIHLGGALSPFNAWLIMRGITTLPIRMKAHEENALKVARFLEAHPQVKQVIYPGLATHPQHELAKRQMSNFSGMIAFQTHNPVAITQAFANHLQIIHYAVSLGHQRSLIYYISTQEMIETSFILNEAQEASYRSFAGDGVFRFSVGLEDVEDICQDLERSMGIKGLG